MHAFHVNVSPSRPPIARLRRPRRNIFHVAYSTSSMWLALATRPSLSHSELTLLLIYVSKREGPTVSVPHLLTSIMRTKLLPFDKCGSRGIGCIHLHLRSPGVRNEVFCQFLPARNESPVNSCAVELVSSSPFQRYQKLIFQIFKPFFPEKHRVSILTPYAFF